MSAPLRYGLIGCGVFGRFCLEQFSRMGNVRCVAVADTDESLARKTAAEHGTDWCATPRDLLARPDVDLVHLATPPFTHGELACAALTAGKHVLCEKPLAVSMADAQRMTALAGEKNLILAVNLMMRYNPLCRAVKALVDSGHLGRPLHAAFVNAAQDETLTPAHWFWDRTKSGGIFIEHGVHFFDLFEWWFGTGEVLSAVQLKRPGTDIVDQVQCAVRYGNLTLGTFYHGFHQMRSRDQQSWRIVFELGTLTMTEWVPTALELDASLTSQGLEEVLKILPGASVRMMERHADEARHPASRHQRRTIDLRAHISTVPVGKMTLYGEMVSHLLADQIARIADPSHVRTVDESNGLRSLAYAAQAQAIADGMQERESWTA
ncbi:MAG: Gfo/Idh/MocA family oxidoreductase [Verrucomicrobiota bacterium]